MSQVICIGEILFDDLAEQLGRPLEDVTSWQSYPGGAPANVACGLVKLGTSAAFWGCVGQDLAGKELVELLRTIGVNTEGIQYHETAPTRKVYVTRSLVGERHFAGFGKINTTQFADTRLQADLLPLSALKKAQYLVTGTLGLAYRDSRQAILKTLASAQQQGVKVFVDINWRPVFWTNPEDAPSMIESILSHATILKCSDEEAQWLFATEDPSVIKGKFPHLQGILITAGEKGCTYCIGASQTHQSVFRVNTIDTTGAGDSFVAGFLHQCCQMGNDIFKDANLAQKAIIYASAVGALTTTQAGAIAAQPTAEEVQRFLILNRH